MSDAAEIRKEDERRALYVSRKLKNPKPLLAWAKSVGIANPMPAEELHVTIIYSKAPVDWLDMGESWTDEVIVREGGPRVLKRFGEALVLAFASSDLRYRNEQMREAGASFDFPEYTPHVTISYLDPDVDIEAIQPYTGELVFGPEIFEPIEDEWHTKVTKDGSHPDLALLPAPARRLAKQFGPGDAAGPLEAAGWHDDGRGGWCRTSPGLPSPRALWGLRAAAASLDMAGMLAKSYKTQARVPSGPKGGQWTAGGGIGLGGDGKALVLPQLGQAGLARSRFEEDPAQRAFMQPLTDAEITGQEPYLGNPHGYVLKQPSTPTSTQDNQNPEGKATFTADTDPGEGLNGIPFEPWSGPAGGDWSKVGGTGTFDEPPYPKAGGKRLGAGVIVEEPDGRIWTVSPLNGFGGYTETFPKGGIEPGLNLRQTAIKEAFEESGLRVELTGVLADVERTTSVARYYTARRVGGDPTGFHWETQATNLVPKDDLADSLMHLADGPILAALSGAGEAVIKALAAYADLAETGMPDEILKKGGWKKQLRVPAGSPKGGEWTVYGSGGWGAAQGFLGNDLELQKFPGQGPQAEKLNQNITAMQAAANAGTTHPYAAKLIAGPKPKQTYSAIAYDSAKEAVAYVAAKGANPGPKPAVATTTSIMSPGNGVKFQNEDFSPNLTKQQEAMKNAGWQAVATLGGKGDDAPQSSGALAAAAAKAAQETGKDHFMPLVGISVPGAAKTGGYKAGPGKGYEAMYQSAGGYRFAPDGKVYTAGVDGAGLKIDEATAPKSITSFAAAAAQDIAALTDTTTPVVTKPSLPQQMKISDLTKIGPKPGGSASGAMFQDASGQKWIVKSYDTQIMARNEVASAKAYNLLGVSTPEMHLIDLGGEFKGGTGVASKFIDDVVPFDLKNPAHLAAAQKDFGAHALMANWDAVGMNFDNIMISKATGTAIMVDPGGAMLMRAMGAPKGGDFKSTVGEIETMRNPAKNPQAAAVFGSMTASQLQASMHTAGTMWLANKAEMKKVFDQQMGTKDAEPLALRMNLRANDMLEKSGALQAEIASTTIPKIAETGIVKPTVPEHSDPIVSTMASHYDEATLNDAVKSHIKDISSHSFTGPGAEFYEKEIGNLVSFASKGDVAAVKAALYQPASPKTVGKPNYQTYLQAHHEATSLAQLVAAKSLKQGTGSVEAGGMLTGATKVSPNVLQAAAKAEGVADVDAAWSTGVSASLSAMGPILQQPKTTAAPISPPPAVPPLPVLSSPANKNYALVAKAAQMKAIADKGGEGAAAEIQAIALTITGTNSFNKKAKSYAADLVQALGGQAAIDATPTVAKAQSMEAGLKAAATADIAGKTQAIKEFGGFKIVQTTHVEQKSILDQMPKPQSYQNWQGGGSGLSSKPEVNKSNEAYEQAIFAAAKNADADPAGALAAVMAIDPAGGIWSKKVTAYKEAVIAAIKGGPQSVKILDAQEIITADGGKANPSDVAIALANEVKIPQNFDATSNQKFYLHVMGAKIDPHLARGLFDAIPQKLGTTNSPEVKALWEKSKALSGEQKLALKAHVGGNWASENMALRNGDKGTSAWKAGIAKAKMINSGLHDVPEGLTVSRFIDHGSMKEWAAMAGQVITDPGINSTGVKPTGGGWPNPTGNTRQLRMRFAKGAQATYIGKADGKSGQIGASSEYELVLPRNTKWLVVGVSKDVGDGFKSDVVDILVLPHDAPE